MYIHKIDDYEVIFDSEEDYLLVTNNGKKKLWIDHTNKNTPYCGVWYGKNCKVHHFFSGCPLKGMMVGHLNGNSLDNRRDNLKVVSRSENQYNVNRKGKYGRWVTKTKNGKFIARFNIHLGTFLTAEEAHQAGLNYFKKTFKEFHLEEKFL